MRSECARFSSEAIGLDRIELIGMLAVSTSVAVAYLLALFAILLGVPGTITLLKGQTLLFIAGFLAGGLVWWIAAFRLARPNSWWARRFYDAEKLQRAQ